MLTIIETNNFNNWKPFVEFNHLLNASSANYSFSLFAYIISVL